MSKKDLKKNALSEDNLENISGGKIIQKGETFGKPWKIEVGGTTYELSGTKRTATARAIDSALQLINRANKEPGSVSSEDLFSAMSTVKDAFGTSIDLDTV